MRNKCFGLIAKRSLHVQAVQGDTQESGGRGGGRIAIKMLLRLLQCRTLPLQNLLQFGNASLHCHIFKCHTSLSMQTRHPHLKQSGCPPVLLKQHSCTFPPHVMQTEIKLINLPAQKTDCRQHVQGLGTQAHRHTCA
mmetsp:Transcript_87982/g.153016  ORF Transcript_87982/g.153016 Transcript_87982/m.153016 type:complete len:137 (-) Transcript_87982:49-459(-)